MFSRNELLDFMKTLPRLNEPGWEERFFSYLNDCSRRVRHVEHKTREKYYYSESYIDTIRAEITDFDRGVDFWAAATVKLMDGSVSWDEMWEHMVMGKCWEIAPEKVLEELDKANHYLVSPIEVEDKGIIKAPMVMYDDWNYSLMIWQDDREYSLLVWQTTA